MTRVIETTAIITAWDGLHGIAQPLDGAPDATIDDITLRSGGWSVEALEVGVPLECRILRHSNGTNRVISVFSIGVSVMTERLPRAAGFYWGKWRIKAEGTVDEDESPSDEWEVMHVVENCIDADDPEYLMVMVPGVSTWQPLENFHWGEAVRREASQ